MKLLIALVVFPVKILTQYGGIIAGVWLAILGQWWAIGYGMIGYLVGSFGIRLILMPGLAFAVPALILFDKGRTILVFSLFLLNQLYTAAVITACSLLILLLFLDRASSGDLWPLLIWSYAVAISPLADKAHASDSSKCAEMVGLIRTAGAARP